MDSTLVSRPQVDNSNPLAAGARLQEFVIERVIGIGGFGIVYQANDTLLHRTVAIKEYMPTTMASRSDGATVSLRSESHVQDFETGKTSFINEARMLARFKHPALIEVFRFWEQNSTAYMATPFYHGRTLKEHLKARASLPDEATLKQFLIPVLNALEHMHQEQVYHRDISPDNIMILEDGQPILLDLGAARRLEAQNAQGLTVLVKPGYAPLEQYSSDAAIQQGPWTDIYGWGATAYFALTGKPPPPSASRVMSDSIINLVDLKPAGYSLSFLAAIDAALAVRPDDRPQSVAAIKRMMDQGEDADVVLVIEDESEQASGDVMAAVQPEPESSEPAPANTVTSDFPTPLPAKKASSKGLYVGAIIGAAGLLAAFWWLIGSGPATQPSAKAPASGVATSTKPAITESASTSPSAGSAAAPVAPVTPAVPAPPAASSAAQAEEPPLAPVADKPATVRLSIKPWGEILVNGAARGVSPPIKALNLPAGDYEIEIRNGDFPPFRSKLTLKAGQVSRLNHAFDDTPKK